MCADRRDQIGGAAVVEEEDALSQSPQRSAPELRGPASPWLIAVRQPGAHVVDEQIGKEVDRLVAQRRDRVLPVVNDGVWQNAQPTC